MWLPGVKLAAELREWQRGLIAGDRTNGRPACVPGPVSLSPPGELCPSPSSSFAAVRQDGGDTGGDHHASAVLAGEVHRQRVPAVVQDLDWGFVYGPFIAPFSQRNHDWEQFAARLGQVVLKARVLAVLLSFDQPGALQLAQPVGEHVARGAGVGGDPGEPVHPVAEPGQQCRAIRPSAAPGPRRLGDARRPGDPMNRLRHPVR
jgi:hypothetical protein